MSLGLFKNVIYKMCLQIYLVYMYKEDLALNNLQWLIYHKTIISNQNRQLLTSGDSWCIQTHLLIWQQNKEKLFLEIMTHVCFSIFKLNEIPGLRTIKKYYISIWFILFIFGTLQQFLFFYWTILYKHWLVWLLWWHINFCGMPKLSLL